MNNTSYALSSKKMNVAYFGGSVTFGTNTKASSEVDGYDYDVHPWRALITRWLRDTLDVEVNEINGTIGGTGTMYGTYRSVDHLKLQSTVEKPDLVFLEFAVNDYYDHLTEDQAAFNMEHIINTIYDYAPQADIVMVLTGNYYTMSGSDSFVARAAHKAVAKAYHIPTIDVATPLWNLMCKENGGAPRYYGPGSSLNSSTWDKYVSDEVHPTKAGYAEYAKTVQAFLEDLFKMKAGFVPKAPVDAYRPANTLQDITTLVAPHVATFAGCTFEDAGIAIKTTNDSFTDPIGRLTTSKANASFSFDFNGTGLSFWLYGTYDQPSNGIFEITVDGEKIPEIAFTNVKNHKVIPITSGLSKETHTVTVKLKADANGAADLDLRYVMIDGDAARSGVSNVK